MEYLGMIWKRFDWCESKGLDRESWFCLHSSNEVVEFLGNTPTASMVDILRWHLTWKFLFFLICKLCYQGANSSDRVPGWKCHFNWKSLISCRVFWRGVEPASGSLPPPRGGLGPPVFGGAALRGAREPFIREGSVGGRLMVSAINCWLRHGWQRTWGSEFSSRRRRDCGPLARLRISTGVKFYNLINASSSWGEIFNTWPLLGKPITD